MNKKLAFAAGLAGLGVSATLLTHHAGHAADHRDSTLIAMAANSAADINDVYTWMNAGATHLNLILTVQPFAAANATFSPNVQYVFHVHSGAAFGATTEETLIICEFASATDAQCWVGEDAYVTGDPSDEAGMESEDGAVKVFAGQRNDPFFFNLDGFNTAVSTVIGAAGGLTFDAANCPNVNSGTSAVLVGQLQADADASTPAEDDFATANVAALVVQVDKDLVTGGGPVLAVWASTHTKP